VGRRWSPFVAAALLLGACASAPRPSIASALPKAPPLRDRLAAGIVTVRVTGQEWNWKTPWAKQGPWTRSMTGLVVPGRRPVVDPAPGEDGRRPGLPDPRDEGRD